MPARQRAQDLPLTFGEVGRATARVSIEEWHMPGARRDAQRAIPTPTGDVTQRGAQLTPPAVLQQVPESTRSPDGGGHVMRAQGGEHQNRYRGKTRMNLLDELY